VEDAIQAMKLKVDYKAWLQNKADTSLHLRHERPQHSFWKSTKCNFGRLSDINCIPVAGKPIMCSGKTSGVFAANGIILQVPSNTHLETYW